MPCSSGAPPPHQADLPQSTRAPSNSTVNMRVTANSVQGHRKYMEDCYKIRFQRESSLYASQNRALLQAATAAGYVPRQQQAAGDSSPSSTSAASPPPESDDILFSYFGIFDGHGGREASQFAKEKLYWKIVQQEAFWAEEDAHVLAAIRQGFLACHLDMWNEIGALRSRFHH